jgi:tetratricopeptide (TPR) repeat protein
VTLLIGEGEGAGMEERVVVVGEGQLPDAVDQAVLKMKKGERAQLVVAPQAQDVDAEAVVDGNKVWELEVTGFEKAKDAWSMTPDEKIAAADRLKGLGTEFFKRGHVRKAMRCYARGAKFVEAEAAGMDADQAAQRKELHTALSLNLALCCNKAAMYRDAVKHCDAVLAGDEANFKALSRRGVAYAGLGEYEAARADLQRAVDLDPSDKAVRRELAAVAMKIKKQEEREKAVFAKLFA